MAQCWARLFSIQVSLFMIPIPITWFRRSQLSNPCKRVVEIPLSLSLIVALSATLCALFLPETCALSQCPGTMIYSRQPIALPSMVSSYPMGPAIRKWSRKRSRPFRQPWSARYLLLAFAWAINCWHLPPVAIPIS